MSLYDILIMQVRKQTRARTEAATNEPKETNEQSGQEDEQANRRNMQAVECINPQHPPLGRVSVSYPAPNSYKTCIAIRSIHHCPYMMRAVLFLTALSFVPNASKLMGLDNSFHLSSNYVQWT